MIINETKDNSVPFTIEAWQAIQLFSLYRLLLSFGFIFSFELKFDLFNIANQQLYITTSYLYFILSLIFLWCASSRKPAFIIQARCSLIADIIIINFLMFVCGGLYSGIGILLIVIVAANSLLLPGNSALLFAIFTICTLIFSQIMAVNYYPLNPTLLHHGALEIAAICITAISTNRLAINSRKKEYQLDTNTRKLLLSKQLTAHIVSSIETGIIAITADNSIALINAAALKLLQIPEYNTPSHISELEEKFQQTIISSLNTKGKQEHKIHNLKLIVQNIEQQNEKIWLIFLVDINEENKKLQQLKLASLGHFSANIAHELRNPLSAISHAAQLLSDNPEKKDIPQLVDMILRHCSRINTTIKNVLSLSSRKPLHKEKINLNQWLPNFIKDLETSLDCNTKIIFKEPDTRINIEFNTSQLRQILINLCENGIKYGRPKDSKDDDLHISLEQDKNITKIHVLDFGEGITNDSLQHIFDPFYSTSNNGAGLGLTIAKELCELNQAELNFQKAITGGAQFSIIVTEGQTNE